jgi:hypothetical protein
VQGEACAARNHEGDGMIDVMNIVLLVTAILVAIQMVLAVVSEVFLRNLE